MPSLFTSSTALGRELESKSFGVDPYGEHAWQVYTGADLRIIAYPSFEDDVSIIPTPVLLTTITGISMSSHRDVFPVRALGFSAPRGWAYGNRTLAGTLIFAQMGDYGIRDIIRNGMNRWLEQDQNAYTRTVHQGVQDFTTIDEIPALDLALTFVNEAGNSASMSLFGVKFIDEGESFTVDEMEWYTTCSYMALAKTPMKPVTWMQEKSMFDKIGDEVVAVSGLVDSYDPWAKELDEWTRGGGAKWV